ncbi:MAG: hypothetical protein VX738_15285 [Planctomycetota bacterium]|nr:hypothetical protein [Planctomycetota bacterium]
MLRLLLSGLVVMTWPWVALQAQTYEKANAANVELVEYLQARLVSGDAKSIRTKYMEATELIRVANDHLQGDGSARDREGLRQYALRYGQAKDFDPAMNQLMQGGELRIDWGRVYLKTAWQVHFINKAGFKVDQVVAQFNRGAQVIWLQLATVEYDGATRFWGLKNWKVLRDGVRNVPLTESSSDDSPFTRLKESLEMEIDLRRFPGAFHRRGLDDVKSAINEFEHATTPAELGTHVYNLCVAGEFEAVGRVLLPAELNKSNGSLKQEQLEVLAALDVERLYANSMVYWQFHWQDSILKSVESSETAITVVFDSVLQFDGGGSKTVEMEFDILRPHFVQGKWFLSSQAEFTTGITPVSMDGVLLDVSNLVEVSGTVNLDGRPLANATVIMMPDGKSPKRSQAAQGLNSRIPSGKTDAQGQFAMSVVYNSHDGKAVNFRRIPPNRYAVGVVNSVLGSRAAESGVPVPLPEVEPVQADKEPGGNATIPLVFANPLGLQSETKFLHVDRPLSQVQIKLTSDGTIEVLADPK